MSDQKELQIIEQKTVLFYDDELIAVRAGDGQIYVSIRQMCQALDIDVQAQRRRVGRNDVLNGGLGVAKIATPGGEQDAHVLRVDLVPLWLAGISTRAIKSEDVRKRLEIYQAEAAKVLWEAFQSGRLTMQSDFEELLQADTPAVQAYRMIMAMAEMARNQVLIESRLDRHDERLESYETRLETVESILGDTGRQITPDQAMQISQAVKTVALELGKQTKKNEFGGVYGEMYRRYGVTSYKEIPSARFEDVMRWLNEWRQSLVGDEPF